ncbi:hypothetical protein [Sphingomonas soli]|uniref:hypothetical protein n=1 Tax=Sphingomonas soli TaxID=266127 RepID=UPI000836235B|nr:hypothetical protein [Sphingomonas soli]
MLEALLILAASAAGPGADPLAQARAGKIQCVMPNEANKTCIGVTSYKIKADGSFESTTTLLIAPTPLITLTVTSPGTVKDGALCGPVNKADFEAAKIEMDGQPANDAVATAVRSQMAGALAPMDGKMGCSTEAADGTVTVTLDGEIRPEMTQKTKWVSPADGYKVGQ